MDRIRNMFRDPDFKDKWVLSCSSDFFPNTEECLLCPYINDCGDGRSCVVRKGSKRDPRYAYQLQKENKRMKMELEIVLQDIEKMKNVYIEQGKLETIEIINIEIQKLEDELDQWRNSKNRESYYEKVADAYLIIDELERLKNIIIKDSSLEESKK